MPGFPELFSRCCLTNVGRSSGPLHLLNVSKVQSIHCNVPILTTPVPEAEQLHESILFVAHQPHRLEAPGFSDLWQLEYHSPNFSHFQLGKQEPRLLTGSLVENRLTGWRFGSIRRLLTDCQCEREIGVRYFDCRDYVLPLTDKCVWHIDLQRGR
jgi:hypothetical protein